MVAPDRARSRMVRALCRGGRVRTPAVEAAFRAVPRHLFLPDETVARAYTDEAIAVQRVDGAATSSASQPSMMAIMLEQLGALPGHRVLEIGAGTGYNAALLAHLVGPAGAVTAVDIEPDLVAAAGAQLRAAGVDGVELVLGDGARGHPPSAPYDRIVLTVGSADIRPEWVVQLAPGGRLLLPLSVRGSQLSVAFDLTADGVLHSDSVRSCSFIRLRGIGAGPAPTVPLTDGIEVQYAADPAEPVDILELLARPGPAQAFPVPVGAADLWDGFGLWLALGDLATCRLLPRLGGPAPVEVEEASLALAEPGGLAVLGTGRGSGAVRAHGSGGAGCAVRMVEAGLAWVAAGRPTATDLRLTALPAGAAAPGPGVVIDTAHARLLVGPPG